MMRRLLNKIKILSVSDLLHGFTVWRYRHLSEWQFVLIMSLLIGLVAGGASVLLKNFTYYVKVFVEGLMNDFSTLHAFYFVFPALGILLTILIRKYVIKVPVDPGIATVLNAISRKKSVMNPHTTYSYLITAPLTVGFGGSVGLEAPAIGAAIGSNVSRALHLNTKLHYLFLGCATAAALSAIFKVPIAGIVFVIELFSLELTIASLLPLMLSSATGLLVSYFFLGHDFSFNYEFSNQFRMVNLTYYIIMAGLAAVFCVHFTRLHVWFARFFRQHIKNDYHKMLVGGIALGSLVFLMPALWGEGFISINNLLAGNHLSVLNEDLLGSLTDYPWAVVGFMVVMLYFKSMAVTLTFSAGGIGGFFAPSLFLGCIFGYTFAMVVNLVYPDAALSQTNFALVGMTATMAGIVQAPLTAVFMITETTGGYALMLPLMVVAALTFFIVRMFIPHSVYTESLVREGTLITHDTDKTVMKFMDMDSVIEKDFVPVDIRWNLGEILTEAVAKSSRNIYPVVSKENILLGVILLDEIRPLMFEDNLYDKYTAQTLMQEAPEVVFYPQEKVETAMRKLQHTGAWNLPAVDAQGRYLGFVSKSKLLALYRDKVIEYNYETDIPG